MKNYTKTYQHSDYLLGVCLNFVFFSKLETHGF